jgi:hypothetical protein
VSERDPLWLLRDAHSRVTRALEALEDGDSSFAVQTLEDLGADLWRVIEKLEGGEAA